MEPKTPDLFALISAWLTSKGFTFTESEGYKSLNVDTTTHTVNIMENHEDPHGIRILVTGVYTTEEDEKKVNCSPARKFEDAVWSMGISFADLDCRDPDFFESLLTILSSPPTNSTSFNILSSWEENDEKT